MKRPNGRKYSRDLRREEALKRQAERDKLTPKQQLEKNITVRVRK